VGDEEVAENAAGEEEPALAGAAGADVTAGTSVSGVGGEQLQGEDRDEGLAPVNEQAERIGWGKTMRDSPDQPVTSNDDTGQSEKGPPDAPGAAG